MRITFRYWGHKIALQHRQALEIAEELEMGQYDRWIGGRSIPESEKEPQDHFEADVIELCFNIHQESVPRLRDW